MTLSDLIAVMRDGKLVQYGTQREVYAKPSNIYVATFLGKPRMSLVEGTLEQHADTVVFTAPGIRLDLGSAASLGLREGRWARVAAGFRAEDVSLGTANGGLSFEAKVGLQEPIGSDTFVELEVGEATVVARIAPEHEVELGQRVTAIVKPGRVHLFDLETTERINA